MKAYLKEPIPGTDGFWSHEKQLFATVDVPDNANLRLIHYRGRVFYRPYTHVSMDFNEIALSDIVEVS